MAKTIFICSHRTLFSEGVAASLLDDPDLNIIGWEPDPVIARERINELHPDIVLFVGTPPFRPRLDAHNFLSEGVKASIITLDIQTDVVHVYRGEQHTIREMRDLLEVIKRTLPTGL
jgi:chemotaxis response regulator CheB